MPSTTRHKAAPQIRLKITDVSGSEHPPPRSQHLLPVESGGRFQAPPAHRINRRGKTGISQYPDAYALHASSMPVRQSRGSSGKANGSRGSKRASTFNSNAGIAHIARHGSRDGHMPERAGVAIVAPGRSWASARQSPTRRRECESSHRHRCPDAAGQSRPPLPPRRRMNCRPACARCSRGCA